MANTVAQLIIELRAGTAKLATDLNQSVRQLQTFARQTRTIGNVLSYNLTAPLALIGIGAVKAASDFESAFAGVKKTFKGFDQELKNLGKNQKFGSIEEANKALGGLSAAIRKLATEIPTTAVQIAEVVALGQQMGISSDNVMDFAKAMINMGESTNISAKEAAQSLAQFMLVVGGSDTEFRNLTSAIVAVGNNSKTTERDIVNMAMRLGATGRIVNLTGAQVVGLAAALSSVGLEAEAGGTSMSKLLQKMDRAVSTGNGLKQFATIARGTNKELQSLSDEGFAKLFKNDPGQAVANFIIGFDDLRRAGKNVHEMMDAVQIDEIRLIDATQRAALSSGFLTEVVNRATEAWKKGNAAEIEAAQRRETFASQMGTLRNRVNEVAMVLGEIFIPGILAMSKAIVAAVEVFKELPKGFQQVIAWTGVFIAAMGPVTYAVSATSNAFVKFYRLLQLVGAGVGLPKFSKLSKDATSAAAALKQASQSAQATSIAQKGLAVSSNSASAAMGAGGGIAAQLASKYTWLGGVFSFLLSPLKLLGLGLAVLGANALAIIGIGGLLGSDMGRLASGLGQLAVKAGKELPGALLTLGGAIVKTMADVGRWLVSGVASQFAQYKQAVIEALTIRAMFFDSIRNMLPEAWRQGIDKVYTILDNFKNDVVSKFNSVYNAVANGVSSGFETIKKSWNAALVDLGKRTGIVDLQIAGGNQQANIDDLAAKNKEQALKTIKEIGEAQAKEKDRAIEGLKSIGVTSAAEAKKEKERINEILELGVKNGLITREEADLEKKAAKESIKNSEDKIEAIKNLQDQYKQLQLEIEKTSIQEAIDKAVETGDVGKLEALYEQLRDVVARGLVAGLENGSKAAGSSEWANKIAKLQSDETVRVDQERTQKQLQKQAEETHTKTVKFWEGLMGDAISGTRFSLEDQFKKAFTELAAIWITKMIEANAFAADSFGSFFSKAFDAVGGAFDEWSSSIAQSAGASGGGSGGGLGGLLSSASSIFGGSSAAPASGAGQYGSAIGPMASGGNLWQGGGVGQYGSAIGPTASGGNLASGAPGFFSSSGFSWGASSGLQQTAGVVGALYTVADSFKDFGKSPKATGGAVGSGVGAGVGAVFGGPFGAAIGAQVGKFAGELVGGLFSDDGDPARLAREAAGGWFENKIKEAVKTSGTFKIFDEFGKLKDFGKDFVIGDSDRWSKPGWAEEFWGKFGDKGASQFLALGNAFAKIMGFEAEGVGAQIGALLAENLDGGSLFNNLDNIKIFMDTMGITIPQLSEALLQTAEAGNISWHEFNAMNDSLAQIPETGLAGFGDLKKAFDIVLESGGKGIQAVNGLKYVFAEAGDLGIKTFTELRTALAGAGFDAKTLDILFQAFTANGITNMEQLGAASNTVLGGIIGDLEGGGLKWEDFATPITEATGEMDKFTEQAKRGEEQVRRLGVSLNAIPDEKTITIREEFTSSGRDGEEITPNAKGGVFRFARGGVVNTPTLFPLRSGLGLAGEAGPEGILPLKRIGGRLGVSADGMGGNSAVIINVDARGAQAGVEHTVFAAIERMRDTIISDAANLASDRGRRSVS